VETGEVRVEGFIDICTQDGYLEGWARFRGPGHRPCIVSILRDGAVVARASADQYRRDLLAAGVGHGHYGFRSRLLRPLPPGAHEFSMVEESTGEPVLNPAEKASRFVVELPEIVPADAVISVEQLLKRRSEWSDADVAGHVGSLGLEQARRRMGDARFVDVLYMFLLGRRADSEGSQAYCRKLEQGDIDAEEMFRVLLASEERRSKSTRLPSPYDAEFPF